MPRALISTLSPSAGGVAAMLKTVLRLLDERGIRATVAWYEPYSMTPRLSVPSFRLGTRRVRSERRDVEGAVAGIAVGAWLPELEFTHYWPTVAWRELVAGHELHLSVSGSCLAGLPFARTGVPFLAWVASDWRGDRRDRVARFPVQRRWIDRLITQPMVRRLEPEVLRRGRILALSEPIRRDLERVAGAELDGATLPCPIDVEHYRPDPARVVPGRVGFVGRFDDPRKNLPLFLDALAIARERDPKIHGLIVGGEPASATIAAVSARGLAGAVEFRPYLPPSRLVDLLVSLDVVAISSHQEGLGIAFLEAMACACPVVSTRCRGPEEYVVHDENGFLVGFSPEELAGRLVQIVGRRELRDQLGRAARRTVESSYAWARVREIFGRELAALERTSGPAPDGVVE